MAFIELMFLFVIKLEKEDVVLRNRGEDENYKIKLDF